MELIIKLQVPAVLTTREGYPVHIKYYIMWAPQKLRVLYGSIKYRDTALSVMLLFWLHTAVTIERARFKYSSRR